MDELNALVRNFQAGMIRDPVVRVVRPDSDNREDMLIKGNERAVILGGVPTYRIAGDVFRSISQALHGHQNRHSYFRRATISLMRLNRARYNTRHNYDAIAYSAYLDRLEQYGEAVGWDVIEAAADLVRARIVEIFANGSTMMRETIPHDGQVFHRINILSKHAED